MKKQPLRRPMVSIFCLLSLLIFAPCSLLAQFAPIRLPKMIQPAQPLNISLPNIGHLYVLSPLIFAIGGSSGDPLTPDELCNQDKERLQTGLTNVMTAVLDRIQDVIPSDCHQTPARDERKFTFGSMSCGEANFSCPSPNAELYYVKTSVLTCSSNPATTLNLEGAGSIDASTSARGTIVLWENNLGVKTIGVIR